MKPLFVVLTAVAGLGIYASPGFENIIGGPNMDRGVFVSPVSDGGFVAVGVTSGLHGTNEDIYLVKTDSTGTVEWTKSYGGAETDNGWSVHEHAGSFIIAGFTDSIGAGDFDCYLIQTSLEGDQVWSNTYGGGGRDRCWGVLVAAGGGFVLVGETTSSGNGAEDCLLIRTDGLGNKLWAQTFGGAESDRCFSVAAVSDGGFMLAGQTFSQGAGDRDVYVIRTDESGKEQWSKTFGGVASDVGHSVSRTDDGDFIVTGYTTSLAIDEDDPYLIRIGAEGEVRWARVIPMEGINRTLTGEQTTDGGFVLGGFSEYRSKSATAGVLVKTDKNGYLSWFEDYLETTTGRSLGYTVRATPDGGAILTGLTTKGSAGDLDLFLIKVDEHGR